jgi:hypothetical protein
MSPAQIWSQTIDPQSLIGAWEGAWQWRAGEAQSGGQYYLTIELIQGNKVFGSVQVGGRWTREFKVVGTLDAVSPTAETCARISRRGSKISEDTPRAARCRRPLRDRSLSLARPDCPSYIRS